MDKPRLCDIVDSMRPSYERFCKKITVESTGCWIWSGKTNSRGYGMFPFNGVSTHSAHRASWIMNRGPIPTGICVLHKCDTPKCVNPEHLFLGTNADNVADKVSKNRQARGADMARFGSDNPRTRLSDSDVSEIRSLYAARSKSQTQMAIDFGVHLMTIHKIVHNMRRHRG